MKLASFVALLCELHATFPRPNKQRLLSLLEAVAGDQQVRLGHPEDVVDGSGG